MHAVSSPRSPRWSRSTTRRACACGRSRKSSGRSHRAAARSPSTPSSTRSKPMAVTSRKLRAPWGSRGASSAEFSAKPEPRSMQVEREGDPEQDANDEGHENADGDERDPQTTIPRRLLNDNGLLKHAG